jgi:hypothetical protein
MLFLFDTTWGHLGSRITVATLKAYPFADRVGIDLRQSFGVDPEITPEAAKIVLATVKQVFQMPRGIRNMRKPSSSALIQRQNIWFS